MSSYFDQRLTLKATAHVGIACATNFDLRGKEQVATDLSEDASADEEIAPAEIDNLFQEEEIAPAANENPSDEEENAPDLMDNLFAEERVTPAMIGNIRRLADGWRQGLQSRGMQTFPLAFTGDQGNISSKDPPFLFDEVLDAINDRIAAQPEDNASLAPPVRHVHTQIYHRSRITLRRVRAVQDMCMGFFVPRIALREHTSRRAENALRRIEKFEALGSDGKASETRFKQKLSDTPLGVRYENVVMINMDLVQDYVKTSK